MTVDDVHGKHQNQLTSCECRAVRIRCVITRVSQRTKPIRVQGAGWASGWTSASLSSTSWTVVAVVDRASTLVSAVSLVGELVGRTRMPSGIWMPIDVAFSSRICLRILSMHCEGCCGGGVRLRILSMHGMGLSLGPRGGGRVGGGGAGGWTTATSTSIAIAMRSRAIAIRSRVGSMLGAGLRARSICTT